MRSLVELARNKKHPVTFFTLGPKCLSFEATTLEFDPTTDNLYNSTPPLQGHQK
jgi:hypothetical protein